MKTSILIEILWQFIAHLFLSFTVITAAIICGLMLLPAAYAYYVIFAVISIETAVLLVISCSFNTSALSPVFTLNSLMQNRVTPREGVAVCFTQNLGAIAGVISAQAFWNLDGVQHADSSVVNPVAEAIGTALLMFTMITFDKFGLSRWVAALSCGSIIFLVSLIFGSFVFCNPALTLSMSLTTHISSISFEYAIAIVCVQYIAAYFITITFRPLYK